jgi:hypothetical protein
VDRAAAIAASQAEVRNKTATTKTAEEIAADKINASLSGKDTQREYEEFEKISEEDVGLAEEFLFNGYVEKTVSMSNLPKFKHTICTVTAEEMNLIDEIIYEEVRKNQDKDGKLNISEPQVQSLRNSLYIALSYKGRDGKDFVSEKVFEIDIIKKAFKRLSDMYVDGDLNAAQEFKQSLKNSVIKRAVRVRQFGTPLLDFISQKKYELDTKIFAIMNTDKIIPKS